MDVRFNAEGLVPAVVQDWQTGAVLMLGWMNAEALAKTEAAGEVHFYSRSRRTLWRKGETSGNVLRVKEMRIDCDQDALLIQAIPAGPTCHTGARSCFFTTSDEKIDHAPTGSLLESLERELIRRHSGTPDPKSYTQSLWTAGVAAITAKIAEEQTEFCEALTEKSDQDVIHEAADLLFHMMVGLRGRDLPFIALLEEIGRRFGQSGIEEKARR